MGGAKNHQIEVDERGYNDLTQTICVTHVLDKHLLAAAGEPTETVCSFCDRTVQGENPFAVELQTMMPTFFDAFWSYYTRHHDAPSPEGEAQGTNWTDSAVYDLAAGSFDDEVEEAVSTAISEAVLDSEVGTMFTQMDTDALSQAWDELSTITKHVSRALLPGSARRAPLAQVDDFLAQLLEYVDGEYNLVTVLPVGTSFYRGRLVEDIDRETIRTADKLGPAPSRFAAANRMSPAGVPLFYGSADPETAVAEIAAHDVKPWAVIARFDALRPLAVLDLTGIRRRPSPFDADRRREARMLSYFAEFVGNVTRPVIPDDRVHVDYAPTQVITEYLRWAPATKLDGIALPSAQTGAATYVLFVDGPGVDSTDDPVAPVPRVTSSSLDHDDLDLFDNPDDTPTLRMASDSVTGYSVRRRVEIEDIGAVVDGRWDLRVTRARARTVDW